MLARCKKLEIGLAARIAHHEKLFNFLKTAAGPPVLWMPAYLSAGMQRLLGERKAEFGTWQVRAAAPRGHALRSAAPGMPGLLKCRRTCAG